MEGFSGVLHKAAIEGRIHGCKVARSAPAVTDLLFADDSFFFHSK